MYLHINQYGRVDEIVALSRHPLKETDNYLCLYNIHEKYLNNLLQRFQNNLIPDFYKLFRQSWACAIFHDRFADFMEEIKEQLAMLPVKVTILELIVTACSHNSSGATDKGPSEERTTFL